MSEQEERRIDQEIHRSVSGSDPFAAAVRATRMPMLITDPRQPDNPIIFANAAFTRLTGYSREDVLGNNCRFLQGPGTNREDVARVRDSIERRVPIEIDLLNYRKDGTTFWNRLLISPVFDGDQLTYFFASQFDITPEREKLSRLASDRDALESEIHNRVLDLGAAEERLRFALQSGKLGAWMLDLSGERLVASAMCKVHFGRAEADSFTWRDLKSSIHESDLAGWERAIEAALSGSGDLDIDFRIQLPEGETRWIEMRAEARFASDGRPLVLSGVTLDITQRKQAEMHRDLLTRELSHRVKNTLANVQSIVSQSLRRADVPGEVVGQVSQRLQALAMAHDVLTGQGWEAADVREIVRTAIKPFNVDDQPRIAAGGPRVEFSPRAATALTLALHELATNAVKYGALSNEAGKVTVNWDVQDGTFELHWTEFGGPEVREPQRRGFGSRMIEQALSASIQGEAEVKYRPSGIVFSLRTALENLKDVQEPARQY
jgi:PAS domain S-box-containing protein